MHISVHLSAVGSGILQGLPGKVGHRGLGIPGGAQAPLGWGILGRESHSGCSKQGCKHGKPALGASYSQQRPLPVTDVQKHLSNVLQTTSKCFPGWSRAATELPSPWALCPANLLPLLSQQIPAGRRMLLKGREASPCSPAAQGMQHFILFHSILFYFISFESFPCLLSLPESGHPRWMQSLLAICPEFPQEFGDGTQPVAPAEASEAFQVPGTPGCTFWSCGKALPTLPPHPPRAATATKGEFGIAPNPSWLHPGSPFQLQQQQIPSFCISVCPRMGCGVSQCCHWVLLLLPSHLVGPKLSQIPSHTNSREKWSPGWGGPAEGESSSTAPFTEGFYLG